MKGLFGCWLSLLWPAIVGRRRSTAASFAAIDRPICRHVVGLDRNGYVGTYVTLPQSGNVTIDVAAEGAANANMSVVLGDEKASSRSAPAEELQSHVRAAGRHLFLRTELNNDRGDAARQLKINSLSVSGANLANSSSDANALAASDTYIANFRQGPARVKIPGLSVGAAVNVSLKRIDFHFGACVDWAMDPLLVANSAEGRSFRETLNTNFNTIAPDNEMWEANEPARGQVTMTRADRYLSYAAANQLTARMHNMIWEQVQPAWVNTLRQRAANGDAAAKNDLRNAISSRIDYYVGDGAAGNADRAKEYAELDVYNESYSSGQYGDNTSYWNVYGVNGIASIYGETKRAVQDAGASTKLFVNDYTFSDDPNYMEGFMRHVDSLRQAGNDAGYGEIVDAIGLQYYKGKLSDHRPARFVANLQNANVQGLPTQLSEFGGFHGLSQNDAARILDESMRMMFGNPGSIGFLNWYWVKDPQQDQFAPYASLFTVTGGNYGQLQITPAGRVWQDRLGIQDWDGNPNNAWTTQTTVTVGADGTISFDGYYGDYELTVDGKTYNFSLRKGTVDYRLDTSMLKGDFNGDGRVDAADYAEWRDHLGTSYPLNGNGEESGASAGVVDVADYNLWKAAFGAKLGAGAGDGIAVPEPGGLGLAILAAALASLRRRSR